MKFNRKSFAWWLVVAIPFLGMGQQTRTNLWQYYQNKAEYFFRQDSTNLAIVYYQKAYQLVSQTNQDSHRSGYICMNICSLYYGQGKFQEAAHFGHKGLSHLSKSASLPDTTHFKIYSFLGAIYQARSNSDSSYFYFQQADQTLEHNPSIETLLPTYVVYHYINQGRMLFTFQEYQQSMNYFQKARNLSITYDLKDNIPTISSSIAECFDLMGEHAKALVYRRESLRLHLQRDIDKGAYLSGLAWTLYKLKNYTQSLATCKKTIALLAAIPSQNASTYFTTLFKQYWFMAACHFAEKRYDEAERNVDDALRIYEKNLLSKRENLAHVYLLKAQVLIQKQENKQALKYLELVQKMAVLKNSTTDLSPFDIKNPKLAIEAVKYLSFLRYNNFKKSGSKDDLKKAINAFEFAMRVHALVGKTIDDKQVRLLLTEQNFSLYPEAIKMGVEAYKKNPSSFNIHRLFRWFEAFQSNHLKEIIEANTTKKYNLPPHILDEENRIKRQLMSFRGKQSVDMDAYINLQIRWYRFKQQLLKKYPGYYQSIYQQPSFSLASLQQQLDDQTVYVSYIWQNDWLYTLIVTHNQAEVLSQPISAQLEVCLKDLQEQIAKNPGFGKYLGSLSAIYCYQQFIEPLKKLMLNKKHLVINRDPRFQFLPFEILETSQKGKGTEKYNYLLFKYAISYAYSAQWYWQHPSRRVQQKLPKLASKLSNKDPHDELVVAPFLSGNLVPKKWEPISSLEEINEIGGEKLLTTKATKSALLKADLNRKVIHIASHTVIDSADFSNSYIQLYPDHDSHLYFDDICQLPLQNTALVVLGTCEANRGTLFQSEGVLSLARAFAYAGAQAVVTTTWEANNEALSFLSIRLHYYLHKGYATDEALQRARMDLLSSTKYTKFRHPYYWANYILLGNREVIYLEKRFLGVSWEVWAGSVFCLLIIGLFLGKMTKNGVWASSFKKNDNAHTW